MRFPNIPNPVIVNLAEEGQDHGSKGHKSCKRFPWDKERLCEVKWSFMTKSTPATAARGGAGQGHATTLGLLVNSLINFYSEWFVRSLEEVFIMTAAAGIVLAQLYNQPTAFVSFSVWSIVDWSEADAGSVSIILIQAALITKGDAATFVKV